jgi:hypothetical protein
VKRVFWRGGPWVLVRLQSGVLLAFAWEETNLPVPTITSAMGAVQVLLSPQAMLDLVRFHGRREERP